MTLYQETFLGASITDFTGSIGWGGQASTLQVGLVEDPANNDDFTPVDVGTPVIFRYGEWQFGGLMQGFQTSYGRDGNPIYSVNLIDPRELLSGVQLILNDYAGSTYGVDNLYNIYGYLESFDFGASQVNEHGMPWMLVRDAFYTLQLSTPIKFRGAYFLFDPFFGLNLLPSYYRIPGDSISALDYVQNICDALACDFFITMIPLESDETPAANAIKISLVSRNYALASNAITQFINNTEGAVAKEVGQELNNSISNKFVVGGKVNSLFFQLQGNTSNNLDKDGEPKDNVSLYYDDIITPFWGYNANGILAVGTGDFNGPTGHEYQVTLDGRPIYLYTGINTYVHYKTDLAELHAARAGQDTWEAFLWFYDGIEDSIHAGKASSFGLTGARLSDQLMDYLRDWKSGAETDPPSFPFHKCIALTKVELERNNIWMEERRKQIAKVYAYINSFATEYYGKKFMVRIPFVDYAVVPETTTIKFSLLPSQTGYVEESYWAAATTLGYMPFNPERITAQDNRIYPYARFSGMTDTSYTDNDGETVITDLRSRYSFDKVPADSYILDQYPNLKKGIMRENLFVKCSIEEQLVFLNPATAYSPRVVVTLSGPIPDTTVRKELHYTGLLNEVGIWLSDESSTIDTADVESWIRDFAATAGNDYLWKPREAGFNMPDMIAVPLESQILRYGPWYTSNSPGRVEFENDSSLVPWNFGSYTLMNLAGNAKIQDALINQYAIETGSVEYPGVPNISLGGALINSGPIVTDINVNVSKDGVTTRYMMSTWLPRFGALTKYNLDRFLDISKIMQQQRKAFRQFYGYKEPLNYYNIDNIPQKDMKAKTPSATVIAGSMVKYKKGDKTIVSPSVATTSIDTVLESVDKTTYTDKAGVAMDALYVPISTDPDSESENLPKFETADASASSPTAQDLNPFGEDSVSAVFPENDDPQNFEDTSINVKTMAFRLPMIGAGWGYDLSGKIVPGGDEYKYRADLWKTGPIDLRWDDSRKVWTSIGGTWYLGTASRDIAPFSSGVAARNDFMWNPSGILTEDAVFNPHNVVLPSGLKIRYTNNYSGWNMLVAEPFDYTECN